MKIQHIPVSCMKCHATWTGEISVECSIEIAAESMRALDRIGCPSCGASGKGTVAFGVPV